MTPTMTLSRAVLAAALAALAVLLAAAPAHAQFAIKPGSAVAKAHGGDPAGPAVTQAGAHPDLTVAFDLTTQINGEGQEFPYESLRDVHVELPPGFVGSSEATPKCRHRDFVTNSCDRKAIVGVNDLTLRIGSGGINTQTLPVYNLVPRDGATAQLGFQFLTVSVVMTVSVRSDGSYNLATDLTNASQGVAIFGNRLTLWGVPADKNGPGPLNFSGAPGSYGGPGDGPRIPFLTMPTACTGPLETTISVRSWQRGTTDTVSVPMPAVTGCDALSWNPSVDVKPTTTQADTPTGLDVTIGIPQNDDPDGLAVPTLRRAVVELPDGLTINPSTANGLAACTDAGFGLKELRAADCPDGSRVGTVRIDSPAVGEPLLGTVFQAAQGSHDPASGDMYRLFVEAYGQGVRVKLRGHIFADPATGKLTAVFDDNPQLPFSTFRMSLNGGSRAQLATPRTCGPKTTAVQLRPWSTMTEARLASGFAIACPGVLGFAPSLTAGVTNPGAAAHSPFALRISRPDRHQEINGLVMKMPPGLLAKIKDVPLCGDLDATRGICPAETRVGTATIGSGAGEHPFHLQGSVSLTGPYKGAPYGLAITVRAIAGPFDLGTVVVRQAIFVDRKDAHLTVISDPFPTVVQGVPLRIRTIAVDIDRPGFMVNPTSCRQQTITSTMTAPGGAWHQVPTRFQVAGCRALPLRPRMTLKLAGKNERTEGKHPGLRATVTMPGGNANMRKVRVTLPLSLALDPDNANDLCSYEDGQNVSCPESSVVGSATAVSPLLNKPLHAKVYFVQGIRQTPQGPRRTLPTLLIPLRGELAIDIRASSAVRKNKLVTTFNGIPDAAIERFELRLKTGKGGILVSNTNLCRGSHVADYEIDGHNGRQSDGAVKITPPCGKASARSKSRARAKSRAKR